LRKVITTLIMILMPAHISAFSLSLKASAEEETAGRVSVFSRSGRSDLLNGHVLRLSLHDGEAPSAVLRSGVRPALDGMSETDSGDYTTAGIIARNLLLPGLGQRKMGQHIRSKIFFFLEGAAWVGLGTFIWQNIARTDAYEEYAVAYAGVDNTGMPEDYYETIGNYMSSDGPGGYNEYVMREARDMYYPDQEAIESYYNANSITGEDSWMWLSEGTYNKYNSLRKGANSAERRAVYSLFFLLGTRLVSNIDAVRTIMTDTGDQSNPRPSGTNLDIQQNGDGVSVVLSRSF